NERTLPESVVTASATGKGGGLLNWLRSNDALSVGLDMLPVIGSLKSLYQVFSGKDMITGESVNRWVEGAGIVAGMIPGGKLGVKGVANVVSSNAEAAALRRAYLNNKFERTGDINLDINIRERQVFARDFYEEAGFTGRKLESHLKGIDYSRDVDLYTLSRGRPVAQWQPEGASTGNYFSRVDGNPARMGIDMEERSRLIYEPTQRTTVLRSTASDMPSWKGDGRIYLGGETQFFTRDPELFRSIGGRN
ncbi:MAG: polymorphic toxin type 46 domain-containing protein, partial [Moraxellaceae bacterium]|nr:polymorphic toxin type 46 domain-containing protein [Moraxellaceae bacterium]MDZ4385700.1 polymorphic toxin type 46 domain-containing protein [Moraxellaceae bacterium]